MKHFKTIKTAEKSYDYYIEGYTANGEFHKSTVRRTPSQFLKDLRTLKDFGMKITKCRIAR